MGGGSAPRRTISAPFTGDVENAQHPRWVPIFAFRLKVPPEPTSARRSGIPSPPSGRFESGRSIFVGTRLADEQEEAFPPSVIDQSQPVLQQQQQRQVQPKKDGDME
jgi:hypothetical protein